MTGADTGIDWAAVDALAAAAALQAAEIERVGQVPSPLLDAAHAAQLFRICVPPDLGGLGLAPLEWFRVGLRLAVGDASLAWVVGQGGGMNHVISAIGPAALQRELFADPRAYTASGSVGRGRAGQVDGDGMREVEGRWAMVSGMWGATRVGGMCVADDTVRSDGTPEVLMVLVPLDRAELVHSWDTTGLRGTGSDTVVVPRQRVPAHWTFPYAPLDVEVTTTHPIACARRPFWALGFAAVAVQLGLARRALDEVVAFARRKRRPLTPGPLVADGTFVRDVTRMEARWRAGVAIAEQALDRLWHRAQVEPDLPTEVWTDVRLAGSVAAELAAEVLDRVADLAGTEAFRRESPLARCLRDGAVLRHHQAIAARSFESVGRVVLGLEPDNPMI